MKVTRALAGLGALAMIAVLSCAFLAGDLAEEGRRLLAMPWGIVSLVDLYVGFILFSAWVFFREGTTVSSLCWIVAIMALGSLAICLYVLVAARSCKGDWHVLLLGRHARM